MLTLSSGLISVFASTSDQFLGEAKTIYGPAFSFAIAVIWLSILFYVVTRKEAVLPVDIRVPGRAGLEETGNDAEFTRPRLIWILIIPWLATLFLWLFGVYLHKNISIHAEQPAYKVIQGIVHYRKQESDDKYRPVVGAKIALAYGGQVQEIQTNGAGYFKFAIDPKPGHHAITLVCSKKNHHNQTQLFDIHHISGLTVQIELLPLGL